MKANNLDDPAVVSRDEWLSARKELLAKEKELTRTRDALRKARSALPWVNGNRDSANQGEVMKKGSSSAPNDYKLRVLVIAVMVSRFESRL